MPVRTLSVLPRDATAEPVCLLTREWAAGRRESPDRILAIARSELPTARGIEYTFPAGPEVWDRVATFIQEEGECCPFLGFTAEENDGEIRLSVIWPEESTHE